MFLPNRARAVAFLCAVILTPGNWVASGKRLRIPKTPGEIDGFVLDTEPPDPTPPPTPIPTVQPTPSPTNAPSRSVLVIMPSNYNEPLAKCEGQCWKDEDCLPGLRCQERRGDERVPGCEGGVNAVNYCYDMYEDGVPDPEPEDIVPSGSFRLRLYWERGYYWQETYNEAKWCLRSSNPPEIQGCGSGSRFRINQLPGEGDQLQVDGKNLCLEHSGGQGIAWRPCDEFSIKQRWKALWSSARFDIRPAGHSLDGCLSNHHHPKAGERVYVNKCFTAHRTFTGFWNVER